MDSHLLELGVGGIFAVVLIREVLNAFQKLQESRTRKRKSSFPPSMPKDAPIGCPLAGQIDQIHQIISRTDGQGRPLLYSPADLNRLLDRMVLLLEEQRLQTKQIIRILREEVTGKQLIDE